MNETIRVTVVLDSNEDRDLIRWLEGQPNKSAAIRQAIRAHLGANITLADIMAKLEALERTGLTVAATAPQAADEPPDVAAALDGLGL